MKYPCPGMRQCPMCGTGLNDPVWRPARRAFLWFKAREGALVIRCWRCKAETEIEPFYKRMED